MKTVAIIPARIGSTRLPRKPLLMLGNYPVVVHVYKKIFPFVDRVVIATDSEEIVDVSTQYGCRAILTSSAHRSGTDRCLEAYKKLDVDADVVINIQGDEPFVHQQHVSLLVDSFKDKSVDIATLCIPIKNNVEETVLNPNVVKVVRDLDSNALYFSRSVIPYKRDKSLADDTIIYFKHLGMYAYRPLVLENICSLQQSTYEKVEKLEQLRWLQNGYKIKCNETTIETIGIDTQEDLEKAWIHLNKINL